ncbi:hypothetical protein PUR29_09290 [Methylobacterium ajmalii]|uniref:Uncharacterized protein n=1 Tax=Methylobacterium ajmalii TaxID=2738439 RepID=A0ABU9ZQM2_9HYPH
MPAIPAAPGKRSEGPRAPDGTPIETASARTGDDTVTREVIESFRKAVGPAITRDQAAKAPRIEGGAPPTPVPTSLKTEKGSIPVPANSAVAMVDDGPRGHINHGVISLKAPDGSILGQYRFVNGGGGAGTIPHGAYDVTNFRDAASRKAQGLTNLGDTFDLNDVFDARAGRTRTALRIHEAHGDGTLGCIGIQGGAAAWRDFTGKMRTLVEQGGGKYTLVLGSEDGGGQGQGQTPTAQEGFARVLGTTGKAVGGYASPELKADPKAARILDLVTGAELNAGNAGNYNAIFGNAGATEDLSKRTLDQTIAWSRDRGTSSSATGRYQFMADTMAGLKKEMGLTGTEAFTPELQDRMALRLLARRGFGDWKTGKLSTDDFANRLAQEWASLPNLQTGRSHYAGDGVNKALVSPEQVRSVLEGTGAFPGARLASVAKTLTAPVAGSRFLSRVRGMFGGGSGPEATPAPVPEPAPITTRPAPLPGPVQANHDRVLAGLEPEVASVVRRAQADNPNLRLAAVSGRGGSVEVRAVGPDGRAIPVGEGDDPVGAALQRAAGQLGVGVNWASGTRTLSSVKKTLKA